jgi:hypothetical protein
MKLQDQQLLNTKQVDYIYESPDKGKTIYRREFGSVKRVEMPEQLDWVDLLS